MRGVDAGWLASMRLYRMRSLLWAHVVEEKLLDLERAVKANFNPNQPRVPAGNPDGGQWTRTGGRRRDIQGLSDIPKEKPESARLRNAVFKVVAREVLDIILVSAQLRGLVGAELLAGLGIVLDVDDHLAVRVAVVAHDALLRDGGAYRRLWAAQSGRNGLGAELQTEP